MYKTPDIMSNEQRVVSLQIQIEPIEVLRAMGQTQLSPAQAEVEAVIRDMLAESAELLDPVAAYVLRDVVKMTDHLLHLHECPPFEGPIARFLTPAKRVAVFVVTIGGQLEREARVRMDRGGMLEGHILDAIGSAAADAAADALADHVLWHDATPDEAITPPLSPGYCGMPMDQQKPLFAIVDADVIDVRLSNTMMMHPIKSVSGLVGIGDQAEVVERGVPCEYCDFEHCRMKRT
jgi:hypothetical protein